MSLNSFTKLLAAASLLTCTSLFAAPLTVNVAGIPSVGQMGDPGNTVLTFNVGANAAITGISYSVNLTAFDPSLLSEIELGFTDSSGFNGANLNPGNSDNVSGTQSYSGSADLTSLGLAFNVGADGILRLEFYEDFDDAGVNPDGRWNFGTVTFDVENGDVGPGMPGGNVPEPASALLLGAGLAAMGYAGRRGAARKAH